jgi:hypothetical protein
MYRTARWLLAIPVLSLALAARGDEPKAEEPPAKTPTAVPKHAVRRLALDEKPIVVHAVAFAPGGRQLATASADGLIRIWDVTTGKVVHSLKGHDGAVRCLAYSPDGKRLASGGQDRTLRIWDPTAAELWKIEPHPETVAAIAYSPDGKVIATSGGEKTVRTWSAKDGKEQIAYYGLRQPAYAIAFRGDGKLLAAGGRDRTIGLWDVESGKIVQQARGHRSWVLGVAFDGPTLISAGRDQTIRFWDEWSGKTFLRVGGWDGEIQALALARKNTLLVTGDANGIVRFRDARTGGEVGHWAGHTEAVTCLAVSSDSTLAATGSNDGSVIFWALKDVELPEPKAGPLDAAVKETLWNALRGDDEEPEVHFAIRRFVNLKDETIALIRKQVPPVAADANARVLALITLLDSDEFKTREDAEASLLKHGALTVPAVRRALEGKLPSLEVRRRMERILTQLPVEHLQREQERERRALQVLERMNTPESRKLLEELAAGAADAALTLEAKATLERLEKRK